MEVILPAHMAARFAGLYSMRKAGYVLRSARVLGALGYSVEVLDPAHGLSLRGTSDDKLFSGDVVRKLLVQMEQQADVRLGATNVTLRCLEIRKDGVRVQIVGTGLEQELALPGR